MTTDIVAQLTAEISHLRIAPPPGRTLVDVLNDLTLALLPIDLERALRYQQEAQTLAQQVGYSAGLGYARLNIGWMHFWHGNNKLSLQRGEEVAEMGNRLDDMRLYAYGSDLIAATLSASGQVGDSLGYGLHILEIFEQIGDMRGIAEATNIIGLGFAELGDMAEADPYLRRAYTLWQQYGDHFQCATLLNNMVRISTRAHQYEQALEHAATCASTLEHIARTLNLQQPISLWAYLNRNIAALYMELNDLAQAEEYCRRSIAANSAKSDRSLMLLCRQKGLLGRIYQAQGDFTRAREEFVSVLSMSEAHQFVPTQIEGHYALYGLHKAEGDTTAALYHFETCRMLERRIYSPHQTDRNRARNALREAATARQQAEALRERTHQLEVLVRELRALQYRLHDASVRDSLTGLYNRRFLDEQLPKLWQRMMPDTPPLAVLLVDIDNFKQINDTFHHQIGDEVLIRLAAILQSMQTSGDFVVRYGGEEFVVVLAGVPAHYVADRAEQVRAAVEYYPWTTLHKGLRVTISVGVATAAHAVDYYAMLRAADDYLYRAKRGGKNRVVMAG